MSTDRSFGRSAKDREKKVHRADLYPKVLIRPICGGCGQSMILGRSLGRYQSFCCHNALHGIHGCTNRGYKSARIIDEAVLGAVKAALFTDGFITDLTAEVNARLAEFARRPIPSTTKLEQEIAAADRQLKRLTDRLDKADVTHLEVVIAKAEEMGRQLAEKRDRLKELQRAGRRPRVKSVREADVVAALTHLRELLHGDVAVASQILKALVGDVVIEARMSEGKAKPELVARFAINAIPALAVLARGGATAGEGTSADAWDAVDDARQARADGEASPESVVVPLKRKCHRAAPDAPVTPPADSTPRRA